MTALERSNPEALMSPTAAVASAMMKEGMSLTQMYSKLVETESSLRVERESVSRLEAYLKQVSL